MQFRRYRIKSGRVEQCAREWRDSVTPLRERRGFSVAGWLWFCDVSRPVEIDRGEVVSSDLELDPWLDESEPEVATEARAALAFLRAAAPHRFEGLLAAAESDRAADR